MTFPQSAEDMIEVSTEQPQAEIIVKSRNVEIPDHFRTFISGKLARLERLDSSIFRFDVELQHEPNRRQKKHCQRVEITVRGRGPVVRAEAEGENFYAALEAVLAKLEKRLRRARDRRKIHHGEKTPLSVSQATAPLAETDVFSDTQSSTSNDQSSTSSNMVEDYTVDDDYSAGPGQIIRRKKHKAIPMTVDDALYEMELVGHDFYLFHDKDSDCPSVVYRRHAFDYGLITLE